MKGSSHSKSGGGGPRGIASQTPWDSRRQGPGKNWIGVLYASCSFYPSEQRLVENYLDERRLIFLEEPYFGLKFLSGIYQNIAKPLPDQHHGQGQMEYPLPVSKPATPAYCIRLLMGSSSEADSSPSRCTIKRNSISLEGMNPYRIAGFLILSSRFQHVASCLTNACTLAQLRVILTKA
ncbi:hypothetical protein EV356DRAFT_161055 [Viridothelium virens]|uniref:Uncharacterized protein n=1 Tax=Viridothelium virens TaxID=1048519 RepID=A0A6A6HLR4_VIRVR|nr:hypothetical protein EV356DRAFT_161055 [Viridothelium virens]